LLFLFFKIIVIIIILTHLKDKWKTNTIYIYKSKALFKECILPENDPGTGSKHAVDNNKTILTLGSGADGIMRIMRINTRGC
jgi:hypothetical protein